MKPKSLSKGTAVMIELCKLGLDAAEANRLIDKYERKVREHAHVRYDAALVAYEIVEQEGY